uniref:Alpha-ketoglutarate-dependent dioxygenase AlkB-like domain-containing protein n=1 Tax=Aegilops tauschii subsp. strangulata TaxID=200361 RepID=A0A453E3X6_AEGTS
RASSAEAAMEEKATQKAAAEGNPSPELCLRIPGDYAVGSVPTVLYVPDFISQTEQSQLLHHIYQAPAPKWKILKNRRLQNWGGVVHEKGLLPQALPPWLTKITDRICQWTGLFPSAINHVLINEYHPNQGIMVSNHQLHIVHFSGTSFMVCASLNYNNTAPFSHTKMVLPIFLLSLSYPLLHQLCLISHPMES